MVYKKDFDKWNDKKKGINGLSKNVFFNEREIWWCSIGVNIDIEMDGKNDQYERPVLILKKINNQSAWILPITSKHKDNVYLYKISSLEDSSVSISQMRCISVKRLIRKDSRISMGEYGEIVIRIKYLLSGVNEISPSFTG